MISILVLLVCVAIVDRIFLRRVDIKNISLGQLEYTETSIRVPFSFFTKMARFKGAVVSYSLRDIHNPSTVINGRPRTLEHSSKGFNSEYLYISHHHIHADGKWVMRIKITHGDSFWNPVYRIFPIVHVVEKEFDVSLHEGAQQ